MSKDYVQSRPKLSPGSLQRYSQKSAWKSPLLILAIYSAIAGLIIFGHHHRDIISTVLIMMIIGALQHHLMILMHEGAHYLLHPNRKINDFIGDFFCSIPLWAVLRNYRHFHLSHHRWSGTDKDPERELYRRVGFHYQKRTHLQLIISFMGDLIGINGLRFLSAYNSYFDEQDRLGNNAKVKKSDIVKQIVFWTIVLSTVYHFSVWREFLVLWVGSFFTFGALYIKLHGLGEHTGQTGPEEFHRTWTHRFNNLTNFFLYPIRSGYHLEHHLFPTIPWYEVKNLQKELNHVEHYNEKSDLYSVDGYFFGKRSIYREMLLKQN